ncbi:MAG: zf-HC2 domain-containing protein [Acidobacteria bacterium]|nr:zf-HC2 domain-containing protein [Acidobacteriota bacterium]
MNHADTVALGAVEKYFLGELSVAERDEFEAHFFECAECASQLQALEAMRGTLREPSSIALPPSARPWWERPTGARSAWAATVLFAGFIGYQNLVTMPQLRIAAHQPRLLTTIQPDVRFRGTPSPSMEFRVPLQFPPGFARYRIELMSESGSSLSTLTVTASEAASSEGIGFPRTPHQSGSLQVVLYGENASLQPQEIKRHKIYVP